MNKIRLFISVDIPNNIKKEIKKIQENLPDFEGKITETENLHLTLKFLGWIPEEEIDEIKERLRKIKIKEFETQIDKIGFFYPRIVWLHMTGMDSLQKEIDNALADLFPKEIRFMSHLTIARIKRTDNWKNFREDLMRIDINNIKFTVDNFRLKRSILRREGPRYETIEKYDII